MKLCQECSADVRYCGHALEPLDIIEQALIDSPCTSDEAERATEWLAALCRRDWAVRVLDAFCRARTLQSDHCWSHQTAAACDASGAGCLVKDNGVIVYSFEGADEDAARLASARAVFPTLDAAARAELGECP